jgi:hypothetical protein
MYKKISFRSVPKPGPGNRAGFFHCADGAPQKTPLVFEAPTPGAPKRKRFLAAASPHPKPQNQQRSEDNAPISERPKRKSGRQAVIWWDEEEESERDVRLRVERMIAQGKAHPDDRFFYVSWRRTRLLSRLLWACSGGGGIRFLSARPNR